MHVVVTVFQNKKWSRYKFENIKWNFNSADPILQLSMDEGDVLFVFDNYYKLYKK